MMVVRRGFDLYTNAEGLKFESTGGSTVLSCYSTTEVVLAFNPKPWNNRAHAKLPLCSSIRITVSFLQSSKKREQEF